MRSRSSWSRPGVVHQRSRRTPGFGNQGPPGHRLIRNHHGDLMPGPQWSFGVEHDTETVYYVLPQGEARFANSSIDLWLRSLHHYVGYVWAEFLERRLW